MCTQLVLDGQRNTKHPSTPDATAATQSDKTLAEAMPRPASLCAVLAVRNEDVRAGVLTPQIRPLSKYHETVASGVEEIGHGSFVHELGWERVSRPRFTITVHHHYPPPPVMHHLLACLRTLCYLRTGRVSVARELQLSDFACRLPHMGLLAAWECRCAKQCHHPRGCEVDATRRDSTWSRLESDRRMHGGKLFPWTIIRELAFGMARVVDCLIGHALPID